MTDMTFDRFNMAVSVGDTIVYYVKASSSVYMRKATVLEVHRNKLVVEATSSVTWRRSEPRKYKATLTARNFVVVRLCEA